MSDFLTTTTATDIPVEPSALQRARPSPRLLSLPLHLPPNWRVTPMAPLPSSHVSATVTSGTTIVPLHAETITTPTHSTPTRTTPTPEAPEPSPLAPDLMGGAPIFIPVVQLPEPEEATTTMTTATATPTMTRIIRNAHAEVPAVAEVAAAAAGVARAAAAVMAATANLTGEAGVTNDGTTDTELGRSIWIDSGN